MKYIIKFLSMTLILILLLSTAACQKENTASILDKPMVKSNFLLGTIVEITIYDKVDESVFDKVFSRIAEIENRMTINNADTSEIITLNNNSGSKEVKVSPDTFYVLEKGKYYSELSKGSFDITVGPLVKLWNIGTDQAAVPAQSDIDKNINLIDYTKLDLNSKNHTAKLNEANMKVDLGAIAKGYAADEAGRILRENGVKHAIIYLGGNLLTLGKNPNGNSWKIGIQDPFNTRGNFMGILNVDSLTVVTSGSYERYFEENGKVYHHILNPKTGYPMENNLVSVSIVTEKSIDGDGLSTSLFLLGLDEGMKMAEKLDGVEAIFITNDRKVYTTSGLKDNFQIVESSFTLQQ